MTGETVQHAVQSNEPAELAQWEPAFKIRYSVTRAHST